MKGNLLVLLICKIPLMISINSIVHEFITGFAWKWSNFANERRRAIREKTRKFPKPWPIILISVRRNFIFPENGQWLRWFRSKAFLRRTFPAAFVRTSRYISRHRVHVSVIYVISEVFFGSIRLERRARTRVPTPGLWLNRAIGLMLNSSPASYAIRLCAHDKRLRAALPARESAFTKSARARGRQTFRETGHAIGSSAALDGASPRRGYPNPSAGLWSFSFSKFHASFVRVLGYSQSSRRNLTIGRLSQEAVSIVRCLGPDILRIFLLKPNLHCFTLVKHAGCCFHLWFIRVRRTKVAFIRRAPPKWNSANSVIW